MVAPTFTRRGIVGVYVGGRTLGFVPFYIVMMFINDPYAALGWLGVVASYAFWLLVGLPVLFADFEALRKLENKLATGSDEDLETWWEKRSVRWFRISGISMVLICSAILMFGAYDNKAVFGLAIAGCIWGTLMFVFPEKTRRRSPGLVTEHRLPQDFGRYT